MLRIVAADFTFAQIVERLRQAEFETKEKPDHIAFLAQGSPSGDTKKETRKCYCCGKPGQIKPDCKKKRRDNKDKQEKAQHAKPETAGIARIACGNINVGTNDWCVDSGATSNMTSDKSIFVKYENFSPIVGTAKSNLNLHIFGRVNFGAKEVTINRGRKVMARGPKVGDAWILRAYRTEELAQRADSLGQGQTLLWHRRLGHSGAEKLGQISQAVNGMPIIKKKDSPECNTCSLTKSKQIQNRKAPKHSANKRLERVFKDTWGPYKHPSIEGNRGMFVIMDEYPRMYWVYFMIHNSDVLDLLSGWKHQVELESGENLIKFDQTVRQNSRKLSQR
ncbi:hypothetical protein K3495_g7091 [Podosphaera aphanis]|nr:hypothetical protein K3495_g7091 [Podosphaera aphanis]